MRDLVGQVLKYIWRHRAATISESPYSGDLHRVWKGKRLLKRSAVLLASGHYRITEVYKDDLTGLAVTITLDNMEAPDGQVGTQGHQGP